MKTKIFVTVTSLLILGSFAMAAETSATPENCVVYVQGTFAGAPNEPGIIGVASEAAKKVVTQTLAYEKYQVASGTECAAKVEELSGSIGSRIETKRMVWGGNYLGAVEVQQKVDLRAVEAVFTSSAGKTVRTIISNTK